MEEHTIKPEECRSARAFLNWKQADLSIATGISVVTIYNFERGKNIPRQNTLAVIRRAFEARGVVIGGAAHEQPGYHERKTLRASIAAQSMAALIRSFSVTPTSDQTAACQAQLAEMAVGYADALLAVLEVENG